MLNTERLLKHAVQERLAVTICINKVRSGITNSVLSKINSSTAGYSVAAITSSFLFHTCLFIYLSKIDVLYCNYCYHLLILISVIKAVAGNIIVIKYHYLNLMSFGVAHSWKL